MDLGEARRWNSDTLVIQRTLLEETYPASLT